MSIPPPTRTTHRWIQAQLETFSNVPATATAVLATVAALAILYITLCRLVPARTALLASVVMGAGTSTWQISSDALWPHGPGQLWAALALLALSAASYVGAGWALAAALLTRPITAVSTATVGLLEGWTARSVRPVVKVGAPVALGLGALLLYNRMVFDEFSITGGYSDTFTDRLSEGPLLDHATKVIGFFISVYNGVFIWSPIVLVAAVGLIRIWRVIPSWTRSALIAAVVYLVLHARLNRVSGGMSYGYRYTLEPLTLAAPALTLGAHNAWTQWQFGRKLVIVAVAASVIFQLALVSVLECHDIGTAMAPCGFFNRE